MKKKLLYISSAVIIIAITATATCFSLRSMSDNAQTNNNSTTQPTPQQDDKQKADALKTEAIDAMQANKPDQAKKLFNEALVIYQKLGDEAAVADINLQLSILATKPTTPVQSNQPLTTTKQ